MACVACDLLFAFLLCITNFAMIIECMAVAILYIAILLYIARGSAEVNHSLLALLFASVIS